VYPSTSYLSLHYGSETLLLELSPFILYTIPAPDINPVYPLINSYFGDVEEGWVPSLSTFKFSDNKHDIELNNEYGEVMFAELGSESKKSEDCATKCAHKYVLKARYIIIDYYSDYTLAGEYVIVT